MYTLKSRHGDSSLQMPDKRVGENPVDTLLRLRDDAIHFIFKALVRLKEFTNIVDQADKECHHDFRFSPPAPFPDGQIGDRACCPSGDLPKEGV
jgi:hypothetical protein